MSQGSGTQLRLDAGSPVDPERLAELPAPERGKVYDDLELDVLQRAAAEDAVRAAIARRYRRRRAR